MNLHDHLAKTFHVSEFKPLQKEIIETLLKKQDVLAVLPTGAGKSLCYQFPATVFTGLTIVISPLLSLMQDQEGKLREHNISAAYWNSQQSPAQVNRIIQSLKSNKIKLLFMSPEKIHSQIVRNVFQSIPVDFICIDEAHCITQWGHDFRPEYLHIHDFVEGLPNRPVIAAFTATATPITFSEIQKSLKLHNPAIFSLPAYRPNLRYSVEMVPSEAMKRSALLQLLRWWKRDLWGSAVLYTATRKEAEDMTQLLRYFGWKSAVAYHAGLEPKVRKRVLKRFLTQPRALLVATNAFGMGVDKPNVRLVIHHTPPVSLESYAQESGRAGRDGLEAWCVLLYRRQDLERNFLFSVESTSESRRLHIKRMAQKMVRFAEGNSCISQLIANYLARTGEEIEIQGCGCTRCRPARPWNPPTIARIKPELFHQLRQVRQKKAKELNLPPYYLGTDKTLEKIASELPKTWSDLKNLSGIGYMRLKYWGRDILNATRGHASDVSTSGPS